MSGNRSPLRHQTPGAWQEIYRRLFLLLETHGRGGGGGEGGRGGRRQQHQTPGAWQEICRRLALFISTPHISTSIFFLSFLCKKTLTLSCLVISFYPNYHLNNLVVLKSAFMFDCMKLTCVLTNYDPITDGDNSRNSAWLHVKTCFESRPPPHLNESDSEKM